VGHNRFNRLVETTRRLCVVLLLPPLCDECVYACLFVSKFLL
jgi:hypothetical protein